MSIRIDAARCTGCGQCVSICPGSLISRGEKGKAMIRRPWECWGCTACVKACRFDAIDYFLGADIGGRGTRLHVHREGPLLHWIFQKPDGTARVITVDSRSANQY